MDFQRAQAFIAQHWGEDVMPTLTRYIAIPCVSPAFEPAWARAGHMDQAARLLADWVARHMAPLEGAVVELIALPGRTPLLFVDIPGIAAQDDRPIVIYGHLDKQPAMDGWTHGRSAWTPRLEGDRLYGRGGADDGYAVFSALLALLALNEQGLARPRCVLLIEACEESSSEDLPHYIDHLAPRLGAPFLVVALDAMCGNYDQLWTTTSLRGQVAGTLTVQVLTEGVHSGEASGIAPSSFRIATQLLSRLEDTATGQITVGDFVVEPPAARRAEATVAAQVLGGGVYDALPFVEGARPAHQNVETLLIERAWRPQLTITGADGLPAIKDAGAVMPPTTALKLSLRLPPTVDPIRAGQVLKRLLEADPPYGSQVGFEIAFASPGWHSPPTAPWLDAVLDEVSERTFGRPCVRYGGGGGIPFLNMLGERFADAQFVVTGVLGPRSNAHGPNEFLHIPTALNVTAALAAIINAAGFASRDGPPNDRPQDVLEFAA